MGEVGLYDAVRRGVPLVEFTIRFIEGIDDEAATAKLNALADDFHLNEKPYYDDPRARIGSATKEALEQLFGWSLRRASTSDVSETYFWVGQTQPQRLPEEIKSIGLSQPGSNDDGQWYE